MTQIISDQKVIQDLLAASSSESLESNEPKSWKILLVVTAGGQTNATPLLEIGKVLASRGHVVDFGTLDGQQGFAKGYDYVHEKYTLGPSPFSKTDEETAYLRMTEWDEEGLNQAGYDTLMFLGITWPEVYRSLSAIMKDPEKRPDFLLVDYNVKAAQDMHAEFGVPFAVHWPQMPTNQMKAPYTPGITGLQYKILTSEHATIRQRLYSEFVHPLKQLPGVLSYQKWERKMRQDAGVSRILPTLPKPKHLTFVNSFFGVETARDLPPNVAMVGPVLADSIPPMSSSYTTFMDTHKKVVYITFGTHVLLQKKILLEILGGLLAALDEGTIDGVIWAIRGLARAQFDLKDTLTSSTRGKMTIGEIFDNIHPHLLLADYAPQRAIISHKNCCLYITHAGASSTMEAAFHGIPVLVIPIYFDQNQNALRLRDAGVAICLDKNTVKKPDVTDAVREIVTDRTGSFARQTKHLSSIAKIASRRKHLAADMIEETLADFEGRQGTNRPFHLQTADTRMPYWKVHNYDLWLVILSFAAVTTFAATYATSALRAAVF